MMVGMPGSGKTAYAKGISNACKNVVIHSSDAIHKELFGGEKAQSDPGRVFDLLHRRAAIDLRCGKDVIYDAVNLKADDRKKALHAITTDMPTVEKIALVMKSDTETSKENNTSRNRHIPDYAYEKMLAAFSHPNFSEGFDQIISVQLNNKDTLTSADITTAEADFDFVQYTGVFFERTPFFALVSEKIGTIRLHQDVFYPHITFQYMPKIIQKELFGEEAEFRVVGYGNDGLNEGLCVEWLSGSIRVKQLFDEIKIPHITLSYTEYGSAVNSRYLDFKPITPFNICGVFGGFTKTGSNTVISVFPSG